MDRLQKEHVLAQLEKVPKIIILPKGIDANLLHYLSAVYDGVVDLNPMTREMLRQLKNKGFTTNSRKKNCGYVPSELGMLALDGLNISQQLPKLELDFSQLNKGINSKYSLLANDLAVWPRVKAAGIKKKDFLNWEKCDKAYSELPKALGETQTNAKAS